MSYQRRIVITQSPDFSAPQWIKNAWIGLKVPIAMIAREEPADVTELFTNKPLQGNYKGAYAVDQTILLEQLRLISTDAYDWWIQQGFPKSDSYFVFKRTEAEEIWLWKPK